MKNQGWMPVVSGLVVAACIGAMAAAAIWDGRRSAPRTPAATQLVRDLRAAVQLGIDGDLPAAEVKLERLAAKYPNETLVLMNYGVALSGQAKYEEALVVFERVLEQRPDAWAAYGEIASIHRLRGDDDEALQALEAVPAGEGRIPERLHSDPIWQSLDDPRLDALRKKHRGAPETSVDIEDKTVRP